MPERNISYAQNGEDILLWRALGDIHQGTYIDVGANHPSHLSVTKKFYDAGWRGLAIEPNPEFARLFRAERPEDTLVEAVIADRTAEKVPFHLIEGTGLSTLVDNISEGHRDAGFSVRDIEVPSVTLNEAIEDAGLGDRDIHFMVVDTEGAEVLVLSSIDFARYRPWVLMVEATAPLSTTQVHERWESLVLDSGYRFCLFDGLSRVYVANEHADELTPLLSYSAGILDDFTPIATIELEAERNRLEGQLAQAQRELADARDRLAALREEADGAHAAVRLLQSEVASWQQRTKDVERTLSWRITRPLRAVRGLRKR